MLAQFEIEFYNPDETGFLTTKGITYGKDLAEVSANIANWYGDEIISLTIQPLDNVIDVIDFPSLAEFFTTDLGL